MRVSGAAAVWLLVPAGSWAVAGGEGLTLSLKWRHQFQFAGYYAAQAEGYYEEEGLSVSIVEGAPGVSSVDEVLAGRADFGVGDADIVRFRLAGEPVVVCAAIFQHSPYVMMTLADRGIRRPSDLVGRRVMLNDHQGVAQFKAMLLNEGLEPGGVEIVPHSWELADLVGGRVDAMAGYATLQPAELQALGVEPFLLSGADYGVDFYGDTLFTTEGVVAESPERVAAFVRASLRGWRFALDNPGRLADLILELPGVRERGVTRELLLEEARRMRAYILPDLVEIGHMNPGRWQRTADTYARIGMAADTGRLEGFVLEPEGTDGVLLPRWVSRVLAGAGLVWVGVVLWNLAIRRRVAERTRQLAEEIARRTKVEQELRDSERRFRMMFEGAATGIAVISPSGRFLQANPSYCATVGYSEAELRQMGIDDLLHPDERVPNERLLSELIAGVRDHFVTETRCIGRRGEIIWKRASVSLMRGQEGKPVSIVIVAEDVSARHRMERELARVDRARRMLSGCNEALVRAESEQGLLREICRIAVEIGGYRMGWVGFAEQDAARTIRPIAHAGHEDGYLAEIKLSWDETRPEGRGPAGLSIRGGAAVVCADIEHDDRFIQWREPARRRGYRSVVCLPLRDKGGCYGLLGLHAAESIDMGSDEIALLQQLANDLAFGIDALRAREDREKTLEAVLTVSRGVSTSIGAAFFDSLTQSMVTALGADVGVIGRLNPADRGEIRTLALVVDNQRRENVTYRMEGGPCANISPERPAVIAHDVQATFPACGLLAAFGAEAYIGHPLLDADGNMVGLMAVLYRRPVARTEFVLSTLRIFTSRVAAELDRQQVDQRVREQAALLDKAQDAIILRDLDHRITYWNKSAERLYGWSAAEIAGRTIDKLLYRAPADFLEATRQTVARGEWVGELRQVTKSDAELIVECHWTLVRDEDGKPRGVLAINTDITEKKRMEQQFLRAQRMESIGTLAGGIAHDLNNVLAPILMATDMLRMDEPVPARAALLESISASAQRGAAMVGQVLSFARGMDGQRTEVQLRRILQDVERISRDTFPKDIVIECDVAADLSPLIGDATQLHQVLINLCVNARDAMPDGGRLALT
ncbi:MAG: ABC transporter substrate-binding protein, partial [Verrucomicrobiota bacterium]